jgi:hypothetical protein
MQMSTVKRFLLFWAIGAIVAASIFCLASALPSVFGPLTLPFWVLPGLAGLGAHDEVMPLGLLGESVFYGFLSFLVFWIVARRRTRSKSR